MKTKDSVKKKFIDLIFDFHIIDKNVFYKDLYFKDYLKKMIVKNCNNDSNYKIALYKFNLALIKDGSLKYWVEKYVLQNISDIDNIENLKIKSNSNNLESINIGAESDIANYNAEDNLEQLNILSNDENYDSSIRAIQNSRLIVKISECDIFSAGNEILYCYIRKFKNIVSSNHSRISKKDLETA